MSDYELILESRMATLCNVLHHLKNEKIGKHHLVFITSQYMQAESSLAHYRAVGVGEI